MKKTKNTIVTLIILSLIIFPIFTGCENGFRVVIRGEGPITEQEIFTSTFNKVELAGEFDIEVSYGDSLKVIAQGQQNIIDRLKIRNYNGKLVLELENAIYRDYELKIYVTTPYIEEVQLSGSGNIVVNNFETEGDLTIAVSGSGNITSTQTVKANKINFDISGSGNIDFNTLCTEITTDISGSGNAEMQGSTNIQNIKISGSGNFKCFDLYSNKAYINISGSGDCDVFAQNLLDVDISGSGNVYYLGNPALNINISGSGSIFNQN